MESPRYGSALGAVAAVVEVAEEAMVRKAVMDQREQRLPSREAVLRQKLRLAEHTGMAAKEPHGEHPPFDGEGHQDSRMEIAERLPSLDRQDAAGLGLSLRGGMALEVAEGLGLPEAVEEAAAATPVQQ
jgi:hypothetical protein